MPASMPLTTAGETARNHPPSLSSAAAAWKSPAISTRTPNISRPNRSIASYTITVSPAAGPLTCKGQPAKGATTRPPTTPVIRPAATGAPDAMAMPMQSGNATKKTTTEAVMSRVSVDVRGELGASVIKVLP